ncbi:MULTISPECIES: hypothetical protein [unclassified Beijerinckia]|uniref:hypothetical protein n=1 Tax=unclassified Beijerinckia TaxID=2638183 RepID=UPI000B888B88|nr:MULTISPECIES: hypothetical protein [unclassified Beijerinckia]MDH7799202.1 hypothetical protein [Beijerinckia sp. GAS462]
MSIAISSWRPWRWAGCLLLAALLATQTFWLLPILDARVSAIIAGAEIPNSNHHLLYIATEAAKAMLLFGLSLASQIQLARGGGQN